MKSLMKTVLVAAGVLVCGGSFAQTPAKVTAMCKDGTTYSGASKLVACVGHGGVKAYTTPGTAATTPAPAATGAAAPSAPAATSATAASAAHAGQVWVNTGGSKVYHCPGDRYFGKTKKGEYMTEADAKAKGFHAAGGKACTS